MKVNFLILVFSCFASVSVIAQIISPPKPDQAEAIVVFPVGTLDSRIEELKNDLGATEVWITPVTKARLWRFPLFRKFKVGDSATAIYYSTPSEAVERARGKTRGVESIELNTTTGIPENSSNISRVDKKCPVYIDKFLLPRSQNPTKIKVAILDTGLGCVPGDVSCTTPSELSQYIEVADAYNFTTDYTSTRIFGDNQLNKHGTKVASIIIPYLPNPLYHKVVPIKVLNKKGMGNMYALIQGIDHAIERNVDIINISIISKGLERLPLKPGEIPFTPLESAIQKAQEKKILVVCAAGNDGMKIDDIPNLVYPASASNENLLVVGAEACNAGQRAHFSNFGANKVDLFAPGENLLVRLLSTGEEIYISGTSFAAPIVTGLAAALHIQNRTRNGASLKCAILRGVAISPDSRLGGLSVTGGTVYSQGAFDHLGSCK